MFHFPTFPPLTLCVQVRVTGHDSCRVSPFGNPRITARLTAPRGLSQPPTSFIGSWCQGIHRAPLLTWPQSILMLASTVQFSRYGRCRPGPVAYRRTGRPTRICPTPPRRRLSLDERRAPAGSPRFRLTQPGPSGPNSVLTVVSTRRTVHARERAVLIRRNRESRTGQRSTLSWITGP